MAEHELNIDIPLNTGMLKTNNLNTEEELLSSLFLKELL